MKVNHEKRLTRNAKGNRLKHMCMADGCEKWGSFGVQVNFKYRKPGLWFCGQHLREWKEMESEREQSSKARSESA